LRRLALHVRKLRRANAWSQEEAAYHCDLALRGYQRIEHATLNTGVATLARIGRAFGVEPSRLITPIAGQIERRGPGRPARPRTEKGRRGAAR